MAAITLTVEDTLNLSAFHKRDLVIVTPYDGENATLAMENPGVAIHSSPLSFELNEIRHEREKPVNQASCTCMDFLSK